MFLWALPLEVIGAGNQIDETEDECQGGGYNEPCNDPVNYFTDDIILLFYLQCIFRLLLSYCQNFFKTLLIVFLAPFIIEWRTVTTSIQAWLAIKILTKIITSQLFTAFEDFKPSRRFTLIELCKVIQYVVVTEVTTCLALNFLITAFNSLFLIERGTFWVNSQLSGRNHSN